MVVKTTRVNNRVITKSMAGAIASIYAFLGTSTQGIGMTDTICYVRRR
jgi:hypothetical protein